jgi:hypothetical protein
MKAVYLPWLHMHQPIVWTEDDELIGNLEKMLRSEDSRDRWDGRLMARAYRNPAQWIESLSAEGKHPKIAVDYSGILLENLASINASGTPEQEKTDTDGNLLSDTIPLWRQVLQEHPDSIEFAGTAYAHCYFPVTPEEDWPLQVDEWKKTFASLFGTEPTKRVKGFWLPEMGVPPVEKMGQLVRLLKDRGYEWLILPLEAVRQYRSFSFEKLVETFAQPHFLNTEGGSITVIFRPRYDFIDQQGGCDANGIYQKCLQASRILERSRKKGPALVVPASDGENGNVMMNQFFPDTFIPFFREKSDNVVSSMTISQYIKEYPPDDEIELDSGGSSWLGGHSSWQAGDKRLEMLHQIQELSKEFHVQTRKIHENKAALRALLVAETSCYVYWNSDFWFAQGNKMLEFARKKMKAHSQI